MKRVNLHWPWTEQKDYLAPWYTVLSRLPGFALMCVGRVVFVAGVRLTYKSLSRAAEARHDLA
jgi:hypothetical protein